MSKIVSYLEKHWAQLLIAIFYPMIILSTCYFLALSGTGHDWTILAADANNQLMPFFAHFKDVFSGNGSFVYDYNGALGMNAITHYNYYLGGVFNFVILLFSKQFMYKAFFWITLLKFGAMGGGTYITFSQLFKNNGKAKNLLLTLPYALLSFAVAYSMIIMFLDFLVYLPLLVLGLHYLFQKKRPVLLFVMITLCWVTNFYMTFITGIILVLFFFTQLVIKSDTIKDALGFLGKFAATGVLATISSFVILLPTLIDTHANGENFDALRGFFTDVTAFDLFAKNMVGFYDTSRTNGLPFIYVGLLPLVLAMFYFFSKRIKLKNKIAYGVLLAFFIASFVIDPIQLAWQGFHYTNMFNFRYAFGYSFAVLLMAGEVFNTMTEEGNILELDDKFERLIFVLPIILIMFVGGTFIDPAKHPNITSVAIVSAVFVGIYVALLYYYKSMIVQNMAIFALVFMLIASGVEGFLNTNNIVNGVNAEWQYNNADKYQIEYPQYKELVDYATAQEPKNSFFRLEQNDDLNYNINDTFLYNYKGIAQFASTRNRHSMASLNGIGYHNAVGNTGLKIRYIRSINTADHALGFKYLISKTATATPDNYTIIKTTDTLKLMKADTSVGAGILLTNGQKKIAPFEVNLIDNSATNNPPSLTPSDVPGNSTTYLNYLSGLDEEIYSTATYDGNGSIAIPKGKKAWLLLDPNLGQWQYLGEAPKADQSITLDSTQGQAAPAADLIVYADIKALDKVNAKMTENSVEMTQKGRNVYGKVNAKKAENFVVSMAYDPGWHATVDGKKVEVTSVNAIGLQIKVPAGKHDVKFTYTPPGLYAGAVFTVVGIAGFALWAKLGWKKSEEEVEEEATEETK
ncbi:MAG: YfhO family protein [Lactobacillales bacterium]|jgi:uncharacterized membrane protein YfhO|nr:YfhO family protein [Lactobacillales bacterium]